MPLVSSGALRDPCFWSVTRVYVSDDPFGFIPFAFQKPDTIFYWLLALNLFPSVHKLLNPSSLNPDSVDEDEVELIEKPSLPRWHTVSHSSKMRPMVLTLDEQATGLCKMLRRHGFCRRSQSSPHQQGGVLIIGHSLGTLLSSFFEHQEHDWVVGTIAIDPISVLTFLPDLVRFEMIY